jgi:hypothetical protein
LFAVNAISILVSKHIDLCIWWESGEGGCAVLVALDMVNIGENRKLGTEVTNALYDVIIGSEEMECRGEVID